MSNALVGLQNQPKEPQLGDIEKTKQDNAEYAAGSMDFDAEKKKLMQDLYGIKPQEGNAKTRDSDVDAPADEFLFGSGGGPTEGLSDTQVIERDGVAENSDEDFALQDQGDELGEAVDPELASLELPEIELEYSFEKDQESTEVNFGSQRMEPHYPILSRAREEGYISDSEMISVQEVFESGNSISAAIDVLNNEEVRTALRDSISAIETTPDDKRAEFIKDFSSIDGIDVDPESDIITDIIASNYTKMPDINGEFNLDMDLSMTCQIAARSIMKNVPNLPKDNESFKTAISNLASGDHIKEYEGLAILFNLAGQKTGTGQLKRQQSAKIKEGENIATAKTQANFDSSQASLKSSQEANIAKGKEDNLAQAELKNQDAGESGDVFSASKIDTLDKKNIDKNTIDQDPLAFV